MAVGGVTRPSRSEAMSSGLTHYFSDRPCPRGHVTERYTSTGSCVVCLLARTRAQTEAGYFRDLYPGKRSVLLARCKERYAATREIRIEAAKVWCLNNKDRVLITKKNYKAKRRTKELSGVSTRELRMWFSVQPKVCHWCNGDCGNASQIDHYMPLSKGGRHELDNLVIACVLCNRRKNARHPEEFRLLPASGYYAPRPDMLMEAAA